MLQGGVGCIRLKPVSISNEPFWLMTATSDGVAHAGVPVALPRKLCSPLLPHMHAKGSVCATVHGDLDFVPDPFSSLFEQSVMVPRLYLKVTEIELRPPTPVSPKISVAVSFVSDFERRACIYVTYATFRPDLKNSFQESVSWLKTEYVEGYYGGRIITDFDQTRTVFPEAQLPLRKVMDRQIERGALRDSIELMHATASVEDYFDEIGRRDLLPRKRLEDRTKVFISYAHAAESRTRWVDRIRTHLLTLPQSLDLEIWDDSRIEAGQRWESEIAHAIRYARVAILVLTADFLASDFIRKAELPPLLEAAEAEGATILCVYGSDVHLSGVAERLSQYQFVNSLDVPLQALTEATRESVYKRLTQLVEKAFGQTLSAQSGPDVFFIILFDEIEKARPLKRFLRHELESKIARSLIGGQFAFVWLFISKLKVSALTTTPK